MLIACGILAANAGMAALAEDLPMVIAPAPETSEALEIAPAPYADSYSVVVGGETLDLGENAVYVSDGHLMIPLRAVAEKLGFTVTWDAEYRGIALDNGTVNSKISVGEDNYFAASSFAIGMSAPVSLGVAPVIKNNTTFVPIEFFNVINWGEEAYTVEDGVIAFKPYEKVEIIEEDNTRIPNPFTEYDTVEDAKKAMTFEALVPSKLPDGYRLGFVHSLGNDFLQVNYENAQGKEIKYRVALGDGNISGDYNVYNDVKDITVGDTTVTLSKNGDVSSAVWTKGGLAYALYADGALTDAEVADIIANLG